MLAFLMTAFVAFSQKDSTNKKDTCFCVTPSQMRKAIQKDDSLQIIKDVVILQDQVISEMQNGLNKNDSLVKKYSTLVDANLKIIGNLDAQVSNLAKSNQLSLDYNSYLKKEIKKQKKKTFTIAGVSLSIISYLLFK